MDNTYDKIFYPEGRFIGGIDESGVVDIAGPIISACVVLPKIDVRTDDLRIFEIDDSKTIAEKYRASHAEIIWQNAVAIGIGEVTPAEVDYLGKRMSCDLAMLRAIASCKRVSNGKGVMPDFLIIDGSQPLHTSIRQHPVKDADKKSLSVAAASIIAKVYRDNIMMHLHEKYPQYGWDRNKGYPCEGHFKGIDDCGAIVGIHRVKLWPFMFTSKFPEKVVFWKERRKKWRRITQNAMSKDLGENIWSLKTELWKPSITFKNLQSHEVAIGKKLKKRRRRSRKKKTQQDSGSSITF